MIKKLTLLCICFGILTMSLQIQPVVSQTAEDITKKIAEEQARLEETRNNINRLEQELTNAKNTITQAEAGVPFLEATIKQIETQIEVNNAKKQFLQESNTIKKLQTEQRKLLQKLAIADSYKDWKSNMQTNDFSWMLLMDEFDPIQLETFKSAALGTDRKDIDKLLTELNALNSEILSTEELAKNLENQTAELELNKVNLQNQIAALNNTIAYNAVQIGSLMDQQASIQKNITTLTEEQQRAAQREAEILRNKLAEEERQRIERESKPRELDNGKFYFSGYGRDLYQGHGVGMSQWGAHGAARSGMTAEEIIRFYYADVTIERRPGSVDVIGYGLVDINDYAAGIGEVPDKACGSDEQISTNPQKYTRDNPQVMFDCWPEEAIKAQVIAARSYAISYGRPICTSAACQVYQGGEGKRWAAEETKDMVIVSTGVTSNGSVINALYSSDNSQGYGTANNDTIFQNVYGEGTPHSYLRAVNDSAFATPTQWTVWNYQSNTYSGSDIIALLNFIGNEDSGYNQNIKSIISQMHASLGGFSSISFERDASERVKKVIIQGTNASVTIGGWWFKNFWNTWRDVKGDTDFIFSQRFYIVTQ